MDLWSCPRGSPPLPVKPTGGQTRFGNSGWLAPSPWLGAFLPYENGWIYHAKLLGLRSPRRLGRLVALDEGSSFLDPAGVFPYFWAPIRLLALPARNSKRQRSFTSGSPTQSVPPATAFTMDTFAWPSLRLQCITNNTMSTPMSVRIPDPLMEGT